MPTMFPLFPRTQILFALLSLGDFALTWWLLNHSNHRIYEANPLANWWLSRHGWVGLAGFKTAIVALVLGLTLFIARTRPRTARNVLTLGCACLGIVVMYSASLLGSSALSPQDPAKLLAHANSELDLVNRQTSLQQRRRQPFRDMLRQIHEDCLAGRCNLVGAASRFEAFEGTNPKRLQILASLYPNNTPKQRFACWVICYLVNSVGDTSSLRRSVARKLALDYRKAYGVEIPSELVTQIGKEFLVEEESTRRDVGSTLDFLHEGTVSCCRTPSRHSEVTSKLRSPSR